MQGTQVLIPRALNGYADFWRHAMRSSGDPWMAEVWSQEQWAQEPWWLAD